MRPRIAFLAAAMLLTAVLSRAANEANWLLHESFENGIPSTWTQESVRGSTPWTVEDSTAAYPNGSAAGGHHAALRNKTGQTQGYVQRLILPALDLQDVFQPVLIFSHAQMQQTGVCDTLRIYYRTSPDRRWVMLEEYGRRISRWQADTIALPAATQTYQLMFEGTDNFGRGIVLDEVIVRPQPTCNEANGIMAVTTGYSASVSWNGSLDATDFRIIVSSDSIEDFEHLITADILADTIVDSFEYTTVTPLTPNTTYYISIKTNCPMEQSAWVCTSFRTRNVMPVPYSEDFNLSAAITDEILRPESWYYGTNIINQEGGEARIPGVYNVYYFCSDHSYSLCFGHQGNNYVSTWEPLAAGEQAYAATPELLVDDMSTLEVNFEGCSSLASGNLIVGVMTDPTDLTTFVAVDTVVCPVAYQGNKYHVSLADYRGSGRFVAFLSRAGFPNLFAIDNLNIDYVGVPRRPGNVRVNLLSPFTLLVKADVFDADSWDVVVSTNYTPGSIPTSNIVYEQTVTGGSHQASLPASAQGKVVYIYVRSRKGDKLSKAADPVGIFIPIAADKLPYCMKLWAPIRLDNTDDFYTNTYLAHLNTGSSSGAISKFVMPSNLYTSGNPSAFLDGHHTYLTAAGCMSLPMLPEGVATKDVVCEFDIQLRDKNTPSVITIGMTDNPFDLSTFDSITSVVLDTDRPRHFAIRLAQTAHNGRYVAIRTTEAVYLTDACYSEAECIAPSDINASAGLHDINFSWASFGMERWVVRLSKYKHMQPVTTEKTASNNTATLDGLSSSQNYYYSIGTLCDNDTAWSDTLFIATGCEAMPVPFVEDFGNYHPTADCYESFAPACWGVASYENNSPCGTINYPVVHIDDITKNNALALGNPYVGFEHDYYIALPEMDANLGDVCLTITAGLGQNTRGKQGKIYIGVVNDLDSLEQMQVVDSIIVTSDRSRHVTYFSKYTGTGRHIALCKPRHSEYTSVEIYRINVYKPLCDEIDVVRCSHPTRFGADLGWTANTATKWQLVVTDTLFTGSELLTANPDHIITDTLTSSNKISFRSTRLASNTTYYAYVRAVCGGEYGSWSEYGGFTTLCDPYKVEEMGIVDFSNASDLDCWNVGYVGGTSTHKPSIYQNAMLMQISSATTGLEYAIMPELDVDSIKEYQISFRAWSRSAKDRELSVGIVSDVEDIASFVPIGTVTCKYTDEANASYYTVRFNDYAGDYNGSYGKSPGFVFANDHTSQGSIMVDDISIKRIGNCMEPIGISVDSITDSSARVSWNTEAERSRIVISSAEVSDFTSNENTWLLDSIVKGSLLDCSNLEPLHTYYIYIQTQCGTSKASDWSPVTIFTTECGHYLPPFYESFDKASPNLPECWDGFPRSTTSGAGDRRLSFYRYPVVVLPKISADIRNLVFSFNVRSVSGIAVGIASDVSDRLAVQSSFHALDTVYTPAGLPYLHYERRLDDYTGPDGHIVLICIGSSYNSFADDVSVDLCSMKGNRPQNPVVTKFTDTTVELAWDTVPQASLYEVGYSSNWQYPDPSNGFAKVTANSFCIFNLAPETNYYVFVRAIDKDGVSSDWSACRAVTTLRRQSFPMVWHFDDEPQQADFKENWITWNVYSLQSNTATSVYSYNGSKSLILDYNQIVAMPMINGNADTLQLQFKARGGYHNSRTGRFYGSCASVKIGSVNSLNSLKEAQTFLSEVEHLTEITLPSVSGTHYITEDADAFWNTVTLPLAGCTGKYIVFYCDYDMDEVSNRIYIDSIAISGFYGCANPMALAITDISGSSANITWKGSADKYVFTFSSQDDVENARTMVLDSIGCALPGLTANSDYVVSVASVCGNDTSEAISATFSTPCAPFTLETATWTFNEPTVAYTNHFMLGPLSLPVCWPQAGNGGVMGDFMGMVAFGRDVSATDNALVLPTGGSYVVLPDVNVGRDSLELHFYARCGMFDAGGNLMAPNTSSSRTLLAGVMTDPNNMNSFTLVDVLTYDYVLSDMSASAASHPTRYWQEYTLPLTRYTGGQVALMLMPGGEMDMFAIDDLSFRLKAMCPDVDSLEIKTYADRMDLSWSMEEGSRTLVTLAADMTFQTVLSEDTVSAGRYSFTNLQENTVYCVRVQQMCADGLTSHGVVRNIGTLHGLRYYEDFESETTDWTASNWQTAMNTGLKGRHMAFRCDRPVRTEAQRRTFTMLSPVIDLTDVDTTEHILLSFDLAYTVGRYWNIYSDYEQFHSNYLMLRLSDDGGKTFREEDAVRWANDSTGQYVLAEVSPTGQQVIMDISHLKGKHIQLAFEAGGTDRGIFYQTDTAVIHLDNIQVNRAERTAYETSLCQWEEYEDEFFFLEADELHPGDNRFTKYTVVRRGDEKDRWTELTVHVDRAAASSLGASVCDGEEYQGYGFMVSEPRSGIYRRLTPSPSGCDSLTELRLNVMPHANKELTDTICQGQIYTWQGRELRTTSIVTDTLSSLVTGCDSIVTLYLTVNRALESSDYVYLCHNSTLTLGSQTITAAGTYSEMLQSASGCDSLVTWQVEAVPELRAEKRAIIREGQTYSDGSFIGLSRQDTYRIDLKSTWCGCDSVSILHLLVADMDGSVHDTITADQLPYAVDGTTLLPAGSAEGQYTFTVSIPSGNVTLHLLVGTASGLRPAKAGSLAVQPNPVKAFSPVQVTGSFSSDVVSVRVYTAQGSLVWSTSAVAVDHGCLTLPGLTQAGAYVLRVQDGKGVYQAKLIVE